MDIYNKINITMSIVFRDVEYSKFSINGKNENGSLQDIWTHY